MFPHYLLVYHLHHIPYTLIRSMEHGRPHTPSRCLDFSRCVIHGHQSALRRHVRHILNTPMCRRRNMSRPPDNETSLMCRGRFVSMSRAPVMAMFIVALATSTLVSNAYLFVAQRGPGQMKRKESGLPAFWPLRAPRSEQTTSQSHAFDPFYATLFSFR